MFPKLQLICDVTITTTKNGVSEKFMYINDVVIYD